MVVFPIDLSACSNPEFPVVTYKFVGSISIKRISVMDMFIDFNISFELLFISNVLASDDGLNTTEKRINQLHTRQLSRIIRESAGYEADLPLSRTGHQISRIKSSFELFYALVQDLAQFKLKTSIFLIRSTVSGAFLDVFSHSQRLFLASKR